MELKILKKTVKSTHNFAWFLYFGWSEIQWRYNEENAISKALAIQKECIQLNQKSYLPYYQYEYMLLDQKQYQEAIFFLEKANKLEEKRDIIHNLGFCHFQVGHYQTAFELFKNSSRLEDFENISLFNQALATFKINKLEKVRSLAKKLFNKIKSNNYEIVSLYEIGLIFYLLKDYKNVVRCLLKEGLDGIDLFDWQELSYALYTIDIKTWENEINKSIKQRNNFILEIENGHEDWENYSKEDKKEVLNEFKNEVKLKEEVLSKGMIEPILDLSKQLYIEYCGCLLFDCHKHGNRKDDN